MAKQVLIIDDNEDTIAIVSQAFEMTGFEIESVSDGEKGRQRLAASVPDVVVLDLCLPRVDGLAVLASLRADARLSGTYVIVISGATAMLEEVTGANLVLPKPLGFTYLRTLAARLAKELD